MDHKEIEHSMDTQNKIDSELLNVNVLSNDLILKQIFYTLSLRELYNSCSQVSHEWNDVTKRVITNRFDLHHVFHLYRVSQSHHRRSHHSRETHLIGDDIPFISDNFESLDHNINLQLINDIYSRPSLALFLYGSFCPQSKRIDKLIECRHLLPPECRIMSISSSAGLIGTPKGSSVPIETQGYYSTLAGVSYILFPKFSGVTIDMFDETDTSIESLHERNDLKCLIIFSKICTIRKDKNKLIQFKNINYLLDKYNDRIAIGGAFIDNLGYYSVNSPPNVKIPKKYNDMFGLAISGSNVNACSVIITTENLKDTETKLNDFRRNLPFNPISNSSNLTFGFIFICSGRGSSIYDTPNAESQIFSKVFPGVKLFGIFGNGEFGHDFWPSLDKGPANECQTFEDYKVTEKNLWHFYSTVLVMVNIKIKK